MKLLNTTLALLLSSLLAACGGGGGGVDTSTAAPVAASCSAAIVGISYPGYGSAAVGESVSFVPSGTFNSACAGATYAVTGTLPPGLTFNAGTGTVSGTATAVGTYTFAIQLTIPTSSTTTSVLSYSVTYVVSCAQAFSLSLSYTAPITLTTGTSVNQTPLTAPPASCTSVTYSLTSGTLPAGLVLNASTGAITGTPSSSTASTVTVTATVPNSTINATPALASSTVAVNVNFVPTSIAGNIVVSGSAVSQVFVSKANGGLDYTAPINKPMRGLTIEAIQGTAVLARATIPDSGAFSLNVPANSGSVSLRVKAALKSTSGAIWDVQVLDNTNSNAIYALTTNAFTVGAANIVQNVTAGSGWSTSGAATGVRASAPFAILDTVYSAMKKVTSVASTTSFPALKI
jgi:hypothetical protein